MAGIYFHIPFCKKRCIYCDFFSTTSIEEKENYIKAMCRELEWKQDYLQTKHIDTIYFGGGTPSQLQGKDFERIFNQMIKLGFHFSDAEITLEANPDDITTNYLTDLSYFPFNRISLGVQSFDDRELIFLNRRHDSHSAKEAVRLCQAYGYDNLSIDLMYGLPSQTMDTWRHSIEETLQLNIPHVSAYHLIYEEGTPLMRLLKENKITPVDEEKSLLFFETLIDQLEAAQLKQYEISNFAREGFHSRHNSSYWEGIPYLGIGASAHSYNGQIRHWNPSSISLYMEQIKQGISPENNQEILDEKDKFNDFIITRLRTMKGINMEEMELLFGKNATQTCLDHAERFISEGTLIVENGFLRLTKKGIFLSDGIMSELMW